MRGTSAKVQKGEQKGPGSKAVCVRGQPGRMKRKGTSSHASDAGPRLVGAVVAQ